MLLALVALLEPDTKWVPDLPAVGAFIVAALAWLVTNLKGAGTPHPHDIRLFQSIQNLISPDERRFLDSQDFGTLFRRNAWNGVRTIYADWEGPSFEFTDRSLKRSWGLVKEQIGIFSELVVGTTQPARNMDFQTVRTSRDVGGLSDETRREADAMNAAASELVKRLDVFEIKARRVLRT